MQQADYLEALGIVQYRRRVLQTRHQETRIDSPVEGAVDLSRPTVSEEITPTEAHPPASVTQSSSPTTTADDQVNVRPDELVSFDLLMWKTDNLLVWEFSQQESGLSAAKHRLVNNILKALWPDNFQGVQLLQQSWPLAGANAGKTDANKWLGSMLSGHLEKSPGRPVWLMGDVGIELLLGSQDSPEDILGNRMQHPQLDLEFFVGASPQAMFENPIAKAQTWQMLRDIRNS